MEFGELSRAEQEFAAACQSGDLCTLGDGTRPDEELPIRTIRGALVRFFALGGAAETPTHERGVQLKGALVNGHFDLSGADSDCDLVLKSCRFRRAPVLAGARLRSLDLSGSFCVGMNAEGLTTDGAVMVRDGFEAQGTVRLVRARIGADLDCSGGSFDGGGADALNADGARIEGSVFCRPVSGEAGERPFQALGTVRLISAEIGDSVMVTGADMNAGEQKYALSLALVTIRRQLTLRGFRRFDGRLNLSGARTYSLNDDPANASSPKDMILNGFSYVHFAGDSLKDVTTRLDWLTRQKPEAYGQDFWPQPYGQLASVLHAMGHDADARRVLMTKEALSGQVARSRARHEGRWGRWVLVWLADRFLGHVVGYGYRPHRAIVWALIFIIGGAVFFQRVWEAGDMAPGAAPVLVSAEWRQALSDAPDHTAAHWLTMGGAGRDYETFHPFAYSADLFVPLIDLGQQSSWSPSTDRGPLGRIGWWLRWVLESVGWVITALGAAAVTGLVRRG